MIEELLLTHLFRRWNHRSFDSLTKLFLDSFDLMFLARVYQAETNTCLISSTCTTASVDIDGSLVRKIVINNMCKVADVDTASCHVGSDENLQITLTEVIHHQVALSLREVAMKRGGVITIVNEIICNFLSLEFRSTKYNTVN